MKQHGVLLVRASALQFCGSGFESGLPTSRVDLRGFPYLHIPKSAILRSLKSQNYERLLCPQMMHLSSKISWNRTTVIQNGWMDYNL